MIHSLGDRKVITRGDHWVADNATVIGSVVLEKDVSIDQKREIELETN
jgi:carbonic anhydrase/acetyltransferase-like protein (isoleucine patch superfamily)